MTRHLDKVGVNLVENVADIRTETNDDLPDYIVDDYNLNDNLINDDDVVNTAAGAIVDTAAEAFVHTAAENLNNDVDNTSLVYQHHDTTLNLFFFRWKIIKKFLVGKKMRPDKIYFFYYYFIMNEIQIFIS